MYDAYKVHVYWVVILKAAFTFTKFGDVSKQLQKFYEVGTYRVWCEHSYLCMGKFMK